LNEKLCRQSDELTEARAQLRGYSGGLGLPLDPTADAEVIRLEPLSKEGAEHSALVEVFNVPEFTRILICDLKPRLARLLTKCFPAYVILAAFRYYDHAHDETALTGLFSTLHIMLKDTVTHSHDMDVLSLWLVNTWRLFNLLRQYSGEKAEPEWTAGNTEKQNSHRLQSFDIAPIREQLQLRVEDCYQNLMKRAIEPILSPKIVPGILQHETASDVHGASIGNVRQLARDNSRETTKRGLDDLCDFLNFVHAKLTVYGADQVLLGQVFGQIASWICALSLNHLMFRKELCNFEKAVQIKHNVTEIQSWLLSKGLGAYRDALDPLVQACHLLQSRKDESNIDTLCGEMTSKLKPRQVLAILQHYSPSDDFEERDVDAELLAMIQQRLNRRAAASGETAEDQNTLLVMGTYLHPFNSQLFVHSDFPLETLSLPTCLHMHQVCRLL
uniref:Dilute domain-containing protein n=1 Tax=Heligmosomoides polygyrus TaxID=6339 RepID=A0A8L8K7S5_HELPZ